MPKISAPTVPEHRAARRAALLDAAVALLSENPDRAPGLAEVGKRAGLSRPSVYHYFSSSDDLLAAVVEETFPRWESRFAMAMEGGTPPERVRAFVRENLRLVADGEHALARTLATIAPGEHLARRAAEFNARLLRPLTQALTDLGVEEPDLTADLVRALALAGAREVETTGDIERVQAAVLSLLDPYLAVARSGDPALRASD